jgi:signal transduction histidine kinase
MSLRLWITTVSSAGHLALALLAFSTARRTRLGWSVGLASLSLAGWLFAQLMFRRTSLVHWDHAAQIGSFLAVAFGVHVCLEFVGRARALRWVLWATWCTALPLVAASALEPWAAPLRRWPGSFSWALVVAVYGLGWMAYSMVTVLAHRARQSDVEERARGAVLFAALLINTASAMLELTKALGLPQPDLGHLGTLAGTMLTASVVLQTAPAEGAQVTASEALSAGAVGVASVTAVHAVFSIVGEKPALAALSISCLGVLLAGATRWLLHHRALRREREARHGWLGRMTEQLAHDLKNPLAALRGAIEVVERRVAAGTVIAKDDKMLALLRPQLDRIEGVLERYLRTASVVAVLRDGDLGAAVLDAVNATDPALIGAVAVDVDVARAPERCSFDAELVRSAIDNLVRNALLAMPNGGALTVRVEREHERDLGDAAVLTVTDTGVGMDARVLARAGEDFFTTRSDGSGLGLSFVRRVALAHGGRFAIDSKLGRGTTVRLVLPLFAARAAARKRGMSE